MYLFGPAHRGQEQDVNDGERVQFLSTSENGVSYPCEYNGGFFIDTLGVRSFDDYLRLNPQGLKPGRRFFFYERDEDGSDTLVASGTLMPKPQGMHLGDSEAIAVQVPGVTASPSPTIVVQPPPNEPHGRRIAYEEILDALREELDQLRQQNTTLHLRVEAVQRDMIEAERRALAAELTTQIERERAAGELTSARATHAREIAALTERYAMEAASQQQLHQKELEIMTIRAAEERQYAVQDAQLAEQEAQIAQHQERMAEERRLADMLPPENPDRDVLTMLTQVMPLAQPVLATLGDAVRSWIDGWMTERRLRLREIEERLNRQAYTQRNAEQVLPDDASRAYTGRMDATRYPVSGNHMNDNPMSDYMESHASVRGGQRVARSHERSTDQRQEAHGNGEAMRARPVVVDANTLFTIPEADAGAQASAHQQH